MQLFLKIVSKTLIISIVGEIDHHTSEEVRERIDRYIDNNSIKNIIFDFSNVNFMDSAGIGVIIGRYKKVSPMGGKVGVINARPNIKRIMEISGVKKISTLFDNLESALSCM